MVNEGAMTCKIFSSSELANFWKSALLSFVLCVLGLFGSPIVYLSSGLRAFLKEF